MHIGVVLLAMGFIWVYIEQGSYSFESIGLFFKTYPGSWLFFIFLAGFGIKAGFIPLHSWLPHAHPAAPAHISGIMSGVMVKLGIYGILRTISLVSNNFSSLGEVILIVSVLTGIYGISNAAVHRDIKKMLAYCTVENIGIIGIGIGLGLIGQDEGNILLVALGYGGALLHVLNHSLYKSLLFYTAGSVYQQTHTRDMEKLGGLIKHMPHTALVYLLGALAICGLPPLNGFISEFFLYSGLIEGIRHSGFYHIILITLALAGLAIVGGMALLAFTKNFGILFLGQQRTDSHADYTEVKPVRRVPYYMILLIMVSIGLFPAIFITKALTVVTVTFNLPFNWNSELLAPSVKLMSNIGICSAFFIGLICSVSAVRFFITRKKQKNISATWGCGYVAPKVSMQYTGKSFIKPFAKIPGGLIPEIKKYEALEVQEIFPEKRKFFSHFADFFENKIIIKITKPLLAALNVFQFVQNGRIQFYLLYGLVFIVIVLVGTFFNFI
jgi:formate hydrogenlyase subunit 3/multisubunit Na+/H+ antiporter MnhD subunit